jgi:hypothetical protein
MQIFAVQDYWDDNSSDLQAKKSTWRVSFHQLSKNEAYLAKARRFAFFVTIDTTIKPK